MIDLVTTEVARKLIAENVSWIDGELNHVTFERLVKEKLLPWAGRVPNGARLFERHKVIALARRLPKVRPANRIGIVGWLQGKRPKEKKK